MQQPRATVRLSAGEPRHSIGKVNYADTFSVTSAPSFELSACDLVRRGFADLPRPVRAIIRFAWRRALQFNLEDLQADGQIVGWKIMAAENNFVQLQTGSGLMDAALLAWRDGESLNVSTFLHWRRRRLAPGIWAVVGPVHRVVGRYMMGRLARSLA